MATWRLRIIVPAHAPKLVICFSATPDISSGGGQLFIAALSARCHPCFPAVHSPPGPGRPEPSFDAGANCRWSCGGPAPRCHNLSRPSPFRYCRRTHLYLFRFGPSAARSHHSILCGHNLRKINRPAGKRLRSCFSPAPGPFISSIPIFEHTVGRSPASKLRLLP